MVLQRLEKVSCSWTTQRDEQAMAAAFEGIDGACFMTTPYFETEDEIDRVVDPTKMIKSCVATA